jgi:hypothetical protein
MRGRAKKVPTLIEFVPENVVCSDSIKMALLIQMVLMERVHIFGQKLKSRHMRIC